MKKIAKLMILVPALGLGVFGASTLLASGATSSGTNCVPLNGTFQYATNGIASGADNNIAACPINLDDQALGATVNFRARVYDASATAGYSCTGYVYDNGGTLLATTSTTKTTGVAFQGAATFGLPGGTSWTATVPGTNVSTNTYVIQCTMPGNYSTLYSAHVH